MRKGPPIPQQIDFFISADLMKSKVHTFRINLFGCFAFKAHEYCFVGTMSNTRQGQRPVEFHHHRLSSIEMLFFQQHFLKKAGLLSSDPPLRKWKVRSRF
ncbi:MAG: hypothetical protein Ct9H90mP9_1740 [Pseudomonadota bacterium]|nr:MAG: hypothetical protein Ct9H90mP9_1740 [Pseudomonadota bacterium]